MPINHISARVLRVAGRVLTNRRFHVAITIAALAIGVALIFAWRHGIWSWRDYQVYRAMEAECHPVWRDLQFGRINLGDDVEEVIAKTNPITVERYGRFVHLDY